MYAVPKPPIAILLLVFFAGPAFANELTVTALKKPWRLRLIVH